MSTPALRTGLFLSLASNLQATLWACTPGASRVFQRRQPRCSRGKDRVGCGAQWDFWKVFVSEGPAPSFSPPDYQGDYYGPGGNYDFFPHGPPSQAQSPADSSYLQNSGPGSTPLGPLEPPLSGHHSSENQRYTDMISHPDTPSPEPGMTGSLHPIPGEVFSGGPSPPFSMSSNSGYSGALSHPNPELSEAAVW